MIELYRYMLQVGMKQLNEIPEPYQKMLRAELEPAPEPILDLEPETEPEEEAV